MRKFLCNSFSFIFKYASNQSTASAVIWETNSTHQTVGTQGGYLCWTHRVHSNWYFASCLALQLQHLPTNCEQGGQEKGWDISYVVCIFFMVLNIWVYLNLKLGSNAESSHFEVIKSLSFWDAFYESYKTSFISGLVPFCYILIFRCYNNNCWCDWSNSRANNSHILRTLSTQYHVKNNISLVIFCPDCVR